MPRVPVKRYREEKIRDQALPNIQASAGDSSTIARSFTPVDKSLSSGVFDAARDLAGTVGQIGLEEKQRADKSRVLQERAALNDWEYKNIYDPKTGARNKVGRDAFGVQEELLGNYDKFVQERYKSLSNKDQQASFMDNALKRREQVRQWSADHTHKQIQVVEDADYKSSLESSMERASFNKNSLPTEVDFVRNQIIERGKARGWSEEQTAQELKKQESGLYTKVITNMIASGEMDEAEKMLSVEGIGLKVEAREKLVRRIATIKKQNDAIVKIKEKEAYQNNLVQTANDFIGGGLTLERLEKAATNGDITPEVARAFEVALFNPKEWKKDYKLNKKSKTQKGAFLVNTINKLDNKDEIGTLVYQSVESYNQGTIDSKDLAWVIKTANDKIKNPDHPKWQWLDQAVNAVSKFAGDHNIPFLTQRLANAEPDTDPRQVSKEVIKDNAITENPELSLLNDVPNSTYRNGKAKSVYPGATDLKADAKASDNGQFVRVKSPSGKTGSIPKDKLADALKKGFTQVK